MRAGFTLQGGAELEANLRTLPLRVQRGVIRTSVRNAQKVMQRAARARARDLKGAGIRRFEIGKARSRKVSMSEMLARNIVVAAPRRQRPGSYALHVQMRKGVAEFVHRGRRSGRTTYVPAAIEYGHVAGATMVPALPFLREPADATVRERMRVLERELGAGILREAIKGRFG